MVARQSPIRKSEKEQPRCDQGCAPVGEPNWQRLIHGASAWDHHALAGRNRFRSTELKRILGPPMAT